MQLRRLMHMLVQEIAKQSDFLTGFSCPLIQASDKGMIEHIDVMKVAAHHANVGLNHY